MKKGKKYLIFNTSNEQFAISIHKIITIEKTDYCEGMHSDTRIKKVNSYPDFVEGVLALKSKVYPIIEFEYFLNKKPMKRHDENKIILIQCETKNLGILVDDVSTIVELEDENFEKLYEDIPIFITERNGEILIIPDFDVILSRTEFTGEMNKIRSSIELLKEEK